MSDAADRTIPATPRRRESARRLGFMPLSSLPAWVATVATTLLLLPAWAEATFEAATTMMSQALSDAVNYPNSDGTVPSPRLDILLPASLLLPTLAVVGIAAVVGLLVRLLLDGPTWQPGRVAPSLGRISLLAGLARICSLATLTSIVGHACGLALLVAVAGLSVGPLIALLGSGEVAVAPMKMLVAVQQAILPLVAAAAAVASCSWIVARLRFERRIQMTPQEYADEARSMQANPQVRLMRQQRRTASR
jgi:flagellar biosynthesis protein FlhB